MLNISPRIGIFYVSLFMGECHSLKDKRMILKSIKDRVRLKFNVSVCELEAQDKWQVATLGFGMIGSDRRYIESTLQNILSFIDDTHMAVVSDYKIEFI